MKKVRIIVLKTMLNEDLAKEFGICGLKACPMTEAVTAIQVGSGYMPVLATQGYRTTHLLVLL